ncbi:MAG TPA: tetratricopeptide repeat protein [Cyclobacteriaceae bacterium]|jgi:tetratricopeptide (TPR) repeat protein|nr:tetratricopeptide repeat protein [Cyclobacteriaceae bacterium]HNP08105.1 tetratricopeptide repeat protein [Cyclobacteriaceae bacterium]
MNVERIKLLEKFIAEDPDDSFSRYALALELSHEDPNQATSILLALLKDKPQYIPTYYQAGLLLLDQNRLEEAKIILEQGIKTARQQNEHKAATELKQLFEELD